MKLASSVGDALGLTSTGRGRRLVNWRHDEKLGRFQGDLGAVIFDIVRRGEICPQPNLSILAVNELLDSLIACKKMNNGFTSFDFTKGRQHIESLYRNITSVECKWITRIILKDLLLRIEPKTVFDAFHNWIWRIYSVKNDLELACSQVVELIRKGYTSVSRLTDEEYARVSKEFFSPQIGTNIGIMACGRAQGLQQVIERMNGATCFIEQKYDGERMQVHISKEWPEMIRIYSKSGRNSTQDRFRCHEQLLKALKFRGPLNDIRSVIIEGELLVFNEITGQIETFGTVQDLQAWKSVYRGDIQSGARHYMAVLFDLLHLNGKDLTEEPLEFRRRLLQTLVVTEPNWVELSSVAMVDFSTSTGIEQLKKSYSEALIQRMEGLIIKKTNSLYLPGNRSQWLKLKKDYIEGFGDTTEFAVIGVSYGKASSGLLDTLIIGCLTNKFEIERDEQIKPNFVLLFPVENGLNEEERELFDARLKQVGLIKPPSTSEGYEYGFAKGFRHDTDYIVKEPFIVELIGSGFVMERGQPHYVLRFPRIRKIFFDRPVADCLSFQELQVMAVASLQLGSDEEIRLNEAYLDEHAKAQLAEKRRAPVAVRPNRLVFEEENHESPSKLLKSMSITTTILDKLKTELFFHVPQFVENHQSLINRIESKGLETLYHLAAIAVCKDRKCVIVSTDKATISD